MYLWPKLVGYGHTLSCAHLRARYGGLARFTAGAICEIVFSLLQSSITSFHTLLFIVGLLLGRSTVWSGQARDARMVSWGEACRAFWPQTLFGAAVNGGMALACPSLLPWALPYTLGYLVAIPVAVFSASPRLGRLCVAAGLCAVPEDLSPPPEVAALTR
jgi:membrane glycosyltransferase